MVLRLHSRVLLLGQVREKRQERHHAMRMAKAKGQVVEAEKAELANEIHLIKAPIAQQLEREMLKIPVEQATEARPMQE